MFFKHTLTPNIPETEFLSGIKITDKKTREEAAKVIADRWNCAVLSKGGHSEENADDLLYESFLQEEKKKKPFGFQQKESIIQTHTEPAVHFQVR